MKKLIISIFVIITVVACTLSYTSVRGDRNQITKDFDTDADCKVDRRVDLNTVRDTFNIKVDSNAINLKNIKYE